MSLPASILSPAFPPPTTTGLSGPGAGDGPVDLLGNGARMLQTLAVLLQNGTEMLRNGAGMGQTLAVLLRNGTEMVRDGTVLLQTSTVLEENFRLSAGRADAP